MSREPYLAATHDYSQDGPLNAGAVLNSLCKAQMMRQLRARLDDEGIARSQRGRHLPRQHERREVPPADPHQAVLLQSLTFHSTFHLSTTGLLM